MELGQVSASLRILWPGDSRLLRTWCTVASNMSGETRVFTDVNLTLAGRQFLLGNDGNGPIGWENQGRYDGQISPSISSKRV